jgi:hypothetical protein
VTLFLPKGIVGTLADLFRRRRAKPSGAEGRTPNSTGLTTDAREDLPPSASNPAAAE